jgi:hypothetical protein
MKMLFGRGKFQIAQRIISVLFQNLDSLQVIADITEDHGIVLQSVEGRKENSFGSISSLGHGLDQDVDVSGVVEVFVGKEDPIQFGWVEPGLAGKAANEGSRPRVHVQVNPLKG